MACAVFVLLLQATPGFSLPPSRPAIFMARFPGAVASAACSQWTAATTTYDPEQALQPSEKFHEPEGLPLPAPAVHREPSSTSSRRRKKTVRHPRAWFREAWMGFKRRLRTATAPSSSSMHDQSTESHFSRVHVGLGGALLCLNLY